MAKTKFCTHCGAAAGTGEFCTSCGSALDEQPAATTGATTGRTAEPAMHGARAASEDMASASAARPAGAGTTSSTSSISNLPPQKGRWEPSAPPPRATRPPTPAAPPPSETPNGGQRRIPWFAIGSSVGAILVVAAVAAVILVATVGKPAPRAKNTRAGAIQLTNTLLANRQLYVSTQQASFAALLPAGWRAVTTHSAGLTAAITLQSPVDGGATITVGQIAVPKKSLRAEGASLLKSVAKVPGFHQQSSGQLTLAGGRSAWEIGYQAGGNSNAAYVVTSCRNTFEITATVPSARVSVLRNRIATVASTLQGNC